MEYVTRGITWEEQKRSSSREDSKKRYKERRKCLSGFPVEAHAFTYDEIVEYYRHEDIQCLRCGRRLQTLGKHLSYIHDLNVKQYKALYGLPNKKGLSGRVARRNYAEAAKARPNENFNDPIKREEHRKKAVIASQHQIHRPFRSELSRAHLAKRNT
jgi:hypothetical protein